MFILRHRKYLMSLIHQQVQWGASHFGDAYKYLF
jgi:hypothetical protein